MLILNLLGINIFSNISAYSTQDLILLSLSFTIPFIWILTSCLYYQIKKVWLYLIISLLFLPLGLIVFAFPYLKAVRQSWAYNKLSLNNSSAASFSHSLFFKIISIFSGLIVLVVSIGIAVILILNPPGTNFLAPKDTDIFMSLLIIVPIGLLSGSLLVYSRPHELYDYASSNSPLNTKTYRRRLSFKKALYLLVALILPYILLSMFVPLSIDTSIQVEMVIASAIASLIGFVAVFIKVK